MLIQKGLVGGLLTCAGMLCTGCLPAPANVDVTDLASPVHSAEVSPEVVNDYRQSLDRALSRDDGSFARADSSSAPDASWPQMFGPHRTSVCDPQPVDLSWPVSGPPLAWKAEIGTGYGSPVISGHRLVFNDRIGDEEIVQCLDADTGNLIWQHRYPTTFECEVEYSDGPYSTPHIHGSQVFTVGGQGQMICLELESGKVVWQRDLHAEYDMQDGLFPVGSSPLVVGDRVYFNLGALDQGAGVVALDAKTGTTVWEAAERGAGYCTPFHATIHGQPYLFVMTNLGLLSLQPDTGEIDWEIEHYCRSPMSFNSVSPLVVNDVVFVVTGPGPGAICVRVNPDRSHTELWRDRRILDCQYNALIPWDGNVIGFTSVHQGGADLRCIELHTGKLNWKYRSDLRRGQAVMVNGMLVVVGERGHVAALRPRPDRADVVAFSSDGIIAAPCYSPPALAHSRLYVRGEKQLVCFDLRSLASHSPASPYVVRRSPPLGAPDSGDH